MIVRMSLFVLLLAATSLHAQQKPFAVVELMDKVVFATIDRPGDLYVSTTSGEIRKFDKDGKLLGTLRLPPLDLFEAGDGTRSFGFIRDKKQGVAIAYNLSAHQETAIHPEFAISPWLVCPSRNEQWILDSADVSLKKTKGNITAIAYESLWTSKPPHVNDIVYMREYLNFLFILERGKGIHILNNLGKEIRKIEDTNVTSFNFLGEELYYLSGTAIRFIDLYTTESREITLPAQGLFALLTDERLIIVGERQVQYYVFKP